MEEPAMEEEKKYVFGFGFADSLVAETGGVTMRQMHFDAKAIVKAFNSIKPLAERLGVPAPVPRMAGFGYPHVSTLGSEIVFPENSEPKPEIVIKTPGDINRLREPEDYLETPLVKKKLAVLQELQKYCPDTPKFIGHPMEGPVTTAVLLMGQNFLTLPYDDPKRAHKLLSFCTESAINYANAISSHFGEPVVPGPKGMPDDFAGMFPPALFGEFVVPYWERIYTGMQATERYLHSELLRKEHLRFLKGLHIKSYDPSADQYVTPEMLAAHCPCEFTLRIQSWDIDNLSAEELVKRYIHLQKQGPRAVSFYMNSMNEEQKIRKLLEIARKMEGQGNE